MNRIHVVLIACLVGSAAYAGGDPIPVCVGSGGTMRLIDMKQKCASGEQRKLFTEWEEELSEPPEEEKEDHTMDEMRKQFDALQRRVAALEQGTPSSPGSQTTRIIPSAEPAIRPGKGSSPTRITAPFEVVSRSGKVILRVAERVSSMSGGGAHVTIGAGDAGNYGLRVYKDGGTFVAGLGQARSGSGAVTVNDDDGTIVASMNALDRQISVYENDEPAASLMLSENGGTVAVFQGKQPVAFLTRSSHGDGGNVTTTDSTGFGVFSAGSASDGGGEACLNRVTGGGKQRNVCLGVELPSMGLGK